MSLRRKPTTISYMLWTAHPGVSGWSANFRSEANLFRTRICPPVSQQIVPSSPHQPSYASLHLHNCRRSFNLRIISDQAELEAKDFSLALLISVVLYALVPPANLFHRYAHQQGPNSGASKDDRCSTYTFDNEVLGSYIPSKDDSQGLKCDKV